MEVIRDIFIFVFSWAFFISVFIGILYLGLYGLWLAFFDNGTSNTGIKEIDSNLTSK